MTPKINKLRKSRHRAKLQCATIQITGPTSIILMSGWVQKSVEILENIEQHLDLNSPKNLHAARTVKLRICAFDDKLKAVSCLKARLVRLKSFKCSRNWVKIAPYTKNHIAFKNCSDNHDLTFLGKSLRNCCVKFEKWVVNDDRMPGKLTARGFRIWEASTRKKGMETGFFSQIDSCNALHLVQSA